MALLNYEKQVFIDAFNDDGLLVYSRGMGLERILVAFLKLYCDAGQLVFVLNTNEEDHDYFIDQLDLQDVKPLPKSVSSTLNVSEREQLYLDGGVIFITSRILVMDILTDKVPSQLISGILIFKAHRITDSHQEAFILRLYRTKNKTGFIKAFSDCPTAFLKGFGHVERVMKLLFIKKLFLWPRFHADINTIMENHKIDVVEMEIPMLPSMITCQTAVLDLITENFKELVKSQSSLAADDDISIDLALNGNFDKKLRRHLDPIWNEISSKTKCLANNIRTLRQILENLTQYDAINFYHYLKNVRSTERTFLTANSWLYLTSADTLYFAAKERVFGVSSSPKKTKTSAVDEDDDMYDENEDDPCNDIEECPKWKILKEILDEIKENDDENNDDCRILIAANDQRTCSLLSEFLNFGSSTLLKRFKNKLELNANKLSKPVNKKLSNDNELTLTQMIKRDSSGDEEENEKSLKFETGLVHNSYIIFHALYGNNDKYGLIRTLYDLKPTYVILYDPELSFVRQLEVFKATNPERSLRVYFLMYSNSSEEQRYLATIKSEKLAFEYLIKEKATLVVTVDQDGKAVDDFEDEDESMPSSSQRNTNKCATEEKILVDMREFRSKLPSVLHKRNIIIEPATLEVGDYILTPEICVERKSVSDLIGSLNNGRLFNQCQAMCRHYRRPVLLIEFERNKPFSLLQTKYSLSNDIVSKDVMSKLTLLTIHFKRLRLIWSQSSYDTADVFIELKKQREQPDLKLAISLEKTEDEAVMLGGKYEHTAKDLLLKMPGINTKNIHRILNKVNNLVELVSQDEAQLAILLESESNAKRLYNFINTTSTKESSQSSNNTNTNKNNVYTKKKVKKGEEKNLNQARLKLKPRRKKNDKLF